MHSMSTDDALVKPLPIASNDPYIQHAQHLVSHCNVTAALGELVTVSLMQM